MTSSAPWSVKGIDPDAREAAKEQARRSGMTLGEWLSHRIREEGEEHAAGERAPGPLSRALDRLTSRIEIAEQRSTLAVTGIDQSVRGVLARMEMTERDQVALGARFEGALQGVTESQEQIAKRLERLEEHTEGPRAVEAIKGLEGSIARLANQVFDGEGRQREVNADLRRDLGALSARLEQAAPAAAGETDPRLGERLDLAEAKTTAALRSLETAFAQLERRLDKTEDRLDSDAVSGMLDSRLGEIAADLSASVEAARQEMSEQLRSAADGRFDSMEQTLREMEARVSAAEQRSTDAIDRIGHEVLRIAEALNRKVATGEQRTADAIEQVGGEVARVVSSLDLRVQRNESAHAVAMEKVTGDITRVAERLTERIGSAERRSAQAIDDVGEQISRVTERLNQRYDRSANDLAERIRQSEERTVRLLEEARERIDARKAEAAPAVHAGPQLDDSFDAPPFPDAEIFASAEPLAAAAVAADGPPQYVIYQVVAPFGQAFAPAGFTPVTPDFGADDIEAASDFAAPVQPQSEADFVDEAPHALEAAAEPEYANPFVPAAFDEGENESDDQAEFLAESHQDVAAEDDDDLDLDFDGRIDLPPPPAPVEPSAALSTRELIEQARAAARLAQADRGGGRRRPDLNRTQAASGFGGVPLVTRRRKKDRTRTALAASLVLGVVMMTAAGVIIATPGSSEKIAQLFAARSKPAVPDAAEPGPAPIMAVALNPQPIAPGDPLAAKAAPAPVAPAATPASADALFAQGRGKLDAKDKTGLAQVRQAANLGQPEAQRYLAGLYRDGKAGLTKDLEEARRWYERGASGGDRTAMHEIALMQYNGLGGPKNQTSAAEWFRKAADLGSTDSQYNLGVLYDNGLGVAKNQGEAYKWFLLATRDTNETKRNEARAAADRVKGDISPEARAIAERAAAAFVPLAPSVAPAPQVAAASVDYLNVQKTLNRLGYYHGAQNGAASDELRLAIRDYQRDHGITATGVVDAATADQLKVTTR